MLSKLCMKYPYTKCSFRKDRSKNRCLTLIAYKSGMISQKRLLRGSESSTGGICELATFRLNSYREVVDYYRRYYGKINENRKTASNI